MAVQMTPDSSASLLTQQAERLAATRRADSARPDSLQEAARPTVNRADSVRVSHNHLSGQVHQLNATLWEAQRGVGVLATAGESLSEAANQLASLGALVESGDRNAAARLAMANELANLDRTVRGARFDGQKVLDGTDFSVRDNSFGMGAKVRIGGTQLQDMASLLASGGRGITALSLDNPAASQISLQKAGSVISQAVKDVSAQASALADLFNRIDASLDQVSAASAAPVGAAPVGAESDLGALHAEAAIESIAVNPATATAAQATVTTTAVARLLAD